jgi:hypothetical protein
VRGQLAVGAAAQLVVGSERSWKWGQQCSWRGWRRLRSVQQARPQPGMVTAGLSTAVKQLPATAAASPTHPRSSACPPPPPTAARCPLQATSPAPPSWSGQMTLSRWHTRCGGRASSWPQSSWQPWSPTELSTDHCAESRNPEWWPLWRRRRPSGWATSRRRQCWRRRLMGVWPGKAAWVARGGAPWRQHMPHFISVLDRLQHCHVTH